MAEKNIVNPISQTPESPQSGPNPGSEAGKGEGDGE